MEQTCQSSVDWLQQSFHQLASPFSDDIDKRMRGLRPIPEPLSDAFYLAAVSGDDKSALNLMKGVAHGGSWLQLLWATNARLQSGWASQNLPLDAAVQGFWTLWRVFQRLNTEAGKTPTGHTRRGTCLIWVPPGDQHTFGAYVLSERLAQLGWTTEVLTNAETSGVTSRLASTEFDIFGVSIGCDEQFLGVAGFLTEARISSLNPNLTVMAGGPAFVGNLSQYGFLGADILANDVDTALGQVNNRCDA